MLIRQSQSTQTLKLVLKKAKQNVCREKGNEKKGSESTLKKVAKKYFPHAIKVFGASA